MSPPDLSWYTPISNIFKPVKINFIKSLRYEFCFALFDSINSWLGKRLHFYKPLSRYFWFNCCTASIACSNIVAVIFYFNESAFGFQIWNNCFSCLISVHAGIFGVIIGNFSVICHNIYNRKIMTKTYFKIIGIVCRRNFNYSRTEIHFYIAVCNNRYFSMNNWKYNSFPNKIFITFVIRIYSNRRIPQKSFRTCSS